MTGSSGELTRQHRADECAGRVRLTEVRECFESFAAFRLCTAIKHECNAARLDGSMSYGILSNQYAIDTYIAIRSTCHGRLNAFVRERVGKPSVQNGGQLFHLGFSEYKWSCEDCRTLGVQSEDELGDNPEVRPSSAKTVEQIGMLSLTRLENTAIRKDNRRFEKIVYDEAVLAA